MVSMWGSKKDDDAEQEPSHDGESSQHGQQAPRHSEEANERTQLLPPNREGYLSPDDPAVGQAIPHSETMLTVCYRSPLITSGASDSYDTSPSSSP